MKQRQKLPEQVWAQFQEQEKLTDEQIDQFKQYETFLSKSNEDFNLTAVTDISGIVRQHFSDSIVVRNFVDFNKLTTIADIGTGAGFPAIPIKILYPHLSVILIEVTKKRRLFLDDLIILLRLENVEVCGYDWRTFLRITEWPVELFVTKAALDEVELCRAFKPACSYKGATIVYWAIDEWESHLKSLPFLQKSEAYKLGVRKRKLVFFGLKSKPLD
jgi:16S rRNA (guanine(527)-N(7))-methyltransferase RsmG